MSITEHKVRIAGNSGSLYEFDNGAWGHSRGNGRFGSRAEAARDFAREVKEQEREANERFAKQASERKQYESERQYCSTCGSYVKNMNQHVKGKAHQNKVRWEEHQRWSNVRV